MTMIQIILRCLSVCTKVNFFYQFELEYTSKQGKPVVTLADIVPRVAVNGVVMLTFTDSSYLESFYSSYDVSRLSQYRNFIVVAVDMNAYEVGLFRAVESRHYLIEDIQ